MGNCSSSNSISEKLSNSGKLDSLIFVLGGPGSGKGTQCKNLAEQLGYTHLSTGDLFRNEVKQGTERAAKVEELMKSGQLIPTDLTLDILYDAVVSTLATGGTTYLLLDGFPRELSQVDAFKKKFGRDCDKALYFEAPDEVLIQRCLDRGKTSGRADDNEESIKKRIQTYHSKSKPVVDHYREEGLLVTVKANQSPADVWEETFNKMTEQAQPAKGINVTVCGGGNAAHIAAGMFAKNGADVNLFFSFEEEAAKFKKACDAAGGVTVTTKDGSYTGMPKVISAKAEEAIPQADVIVMIVPAFAHEPILKQIAPHLKKGAFVGAIPGPGAFDLIATHVLGDILQEKDITLFAGTSLPWACRFDEYGCKASLLGEKKRVDINARPNEAERNKKLGDIMTSLHDLTTFACKGNFLTATLWPTNCVIHTGISYGIWHDWDGEPLDEAPLFYQNCNEFTGQVLDGLSSEIGKAVEVLKKAGGDLDGWQQIGVYLVDVYGDVISDQSSTAKIFATNDAFRGLKAPVTEVEGGKVVPNFRTRYLTEDLPHGLAVLRGIAEICGVETPWMDKVLLWAQPKIEKEYLVDGKIQGKDIVNSGCPQRFGITTPEQLVQGKIIKDQ